MGAHQSACERQRLARPCKQQTRNRCHTHPYPSLPFTPAHLPCTTKFLWVVGGGGAEFWSSARAHPHVASKAAARAPMRQLPTTGSAHKAEFEFTRLSCTAPELTKFMTGNGGGGKWKWGCSQEERRHTVGAPNGRPACTGRMATAPRAPLPVMRIGPLGKGPLPHSRPPPQTSSDR